MKYFKYDSMGRPIIKRRYGKPNYSINVIDLGKINVNTAISIINELDTYHIISNITTEETSTFPTGVKFTSESNITALIVIGINKEFILELANKSNLKKLFLNSICDLPDNMLSKRIKDYLYFDDKDNSTLEDDMKLRLELEN